VSKIAVFLKCTAKVVRSNWEAIKPKLEKGLPGGEINMPVEGADTRWRIVSQQAPWLIKRGRTFHERVATAVVEACAPAGAKDLSKKEKWVVDQLLNPVTQAAAAVAGDLSAELAKATLWTQRHGGFGVGAAARQRTGEQVGARRSDRGPAQALRG
jgi:hypothetical protein